MDQIYLWMLGVLSTWHVLLHLLRVLLNTLSGCTLLRYLDPFHPCTPGTPQYVRWLHFTQVPRYITSLYSRYFNMSGGYTLLRYLDTFHPCTLGTPIRQVVTLYSGNQDTVHPCTPGPPQYVRWLYFTQVPRCIPSLYSGSSSIRQVVRFYSGT